MKNKVLIFGGVVLITIGIIGFFIIRNQKQNFTPATNQQDLATPTPSEVLQELVWNDPGGFIFNYPAGLKINDHPKDNINYSNLEITAEGKQGKILILARDSQYKNLEEWIKGNKDFKDNLVSEATLGDKSAKKIAFSNSDRITIGIIDDEILFTIEVIPEGEMFWQDIFDRIVTSFKFWYPSPADSGSSGESGEIIEEEEIIE